MLFHNYIEEILGSKVKVKIVRTLLKHPNKTYSGRELAKQIKDVSHMAVFKSLKSLIGFGLVHAEYHGGAQLLRLNKESYLYQPLKELFHHEGVTRNVLIDYIKKIFVKTKGIRSIILFGSIAKKQEEIDSDIDLLIVTEKKQEIKDVVAKHQKDFSEKFGNVISATILSGKELKKKKDSTLIRNIKKEEVLILGEKKLRGT